MSQILVQINWFNQVPETELEYIHEVATQMINDFCYEMTENFLLFGKYTPNHAEEFVMIHVEGHLFMRVQRHSLILYIPDECIDVDVMIELMNTNYEIFNI